MTGHEKRGNLARKTESAFLVWNCCPECSGHYGESLNHVRLTVAKLQPPKGSCTHGNCFEKNAFEN